jgi:hypothetical protein
MTIKEDSGKLLATLYKWKQEGREMSNSKNELLEETHWNQNRLYNAIQYLVNKGFVEGDVIKGLGSTKVQDVTIDDLTPSDIDIVEQQSEFKQTFGFTVNLGLIQFNWGAQES